MEGDLPVPGPRPSTHHDRPSNPPNAPTNTYSTLPPTPPCRREGDYLYLVPGVFDQVEAAEERELPEYLANSRFHKVG